MSDINKMSDQELESVSGGVTKDEALRKERVDVLEALELVQELHPRRGDLAPEERDPAAEGLERLRGLERPVDERGLVLLERGLDAARVAARVVLPGHDPSLERLLPGEHVLLHGVHRARPGLDTAVPRTDPRAAFRDHHRVRGLFLGVREVRSDGDRTAEERAGRVHAGYPSGDAERAADPGYDPPDHHLRGGPVDRFGDPPAGQRLCA